MITKEDPKIIFTLSTGVLQIMQALILKDFGFEVEQQARSENWVLKTYHNLGHLSHMLPI